jgi:hypothetical protein
VKFQAEWRLYINTSMLKNSPQRIGEIIAMTLIHDPEKRVVPVHPKLAKALKDNKAAKAVFDRLRPSAQLEIIRYIARLKTEESVDRNVTKAIAFLLGRERFVGRDKP